MSFENVHLFIHISAMLSLASTSTITTSNATRRRTRRKGWASPAAVRVDSVDVIATSSSKSMQIARTRRVGDFFIARRWSIEDAGRTRTNKGTTTRGRMVNCHASLALTDVLFTTGTVMVMPFYALMISKPNSRVTRNLMESKLLWLILGILYIAAAYLSLNSEDVVRAILNAFTHRPVVGMGSVSLSGIATAAASGASAEPFISRCLTLFSNFMSTPETACASWLHLISLDVFLARGVFLDAMEWGTPCRHSILLCCIFGPLGLLAHAFTRYVHRTFDSMFA